MRRSHLPALLSSALLMSTTGAQTPKPAIQDATKAVREATPLNTNLAPAPTVTRWGPLGGNVDRGLITIEGSGIDPATVRVTHKGTSLVLVEKSATKVVARLGDWSGGSAFEGALAIGSVGGESRVLAEKYQILPRWPVTAPRFLAGSRTSNPVFIPSQIPDGGSSYASYQLRFLDVPGDEIVGEENNLAEAANGYCIRGLYGNGVGIPDPSVAGRTLSIPGAFQPAHPVPINDDPQTFESGRRGAQELHIKSIRLWTELLNGGANCKGRLRIKVRYRDEPDDVRVVQLEMPGLPSPAGRRILVVGSTHEFVNSRLIVFQASTRNTPKLCSAENHEGDYRQSLTDLPGPGSDCRFSFARNDPEWRDDFRILAWNWSGPTPPDPDASSRPRCFIARTDFTDLYGRAMAAGQMGWERFDTALVPIIAVPNVRMECRGNQSSPTVVRARLNSVEILAPATAASWRDAMK